MERPRRYYIRILIIVFILFVIFLAYINEPPSTFISNTLVTVQSGDTLSFIAQNLKTEHLIRSTILFKSLIVAFAGEQKLVAGDYYFNEPTSTYGIISWLIKGNFNLAPVRITIPEGLSMSQIAEILSPKLKNFSTTDFMKYSPEKEGYLFPDTYFFAPDVKTGKIIDIMQKNFEEKVEITESAIVDFGKSEKEVITMASILEEEARTEEDWRIVSGILWKRIEIGMPLQVDASLGYVTGRASSELTKDDLKMDSLYNTYTHKGLPPTPISSPGLKTIMAAVTPTETPYLYYLSDENGVIHYAASFADHIKNREKYLK